MKIKLPRCKNCKALQIKIEKYLMDKCIHCHSDLEEVEFEEIIKNEN